VEAVKERIFFWAIRKIFRHAEGQRLPWYLYWLRIVLFPYQAFVYKANSSQRFSYNMEDDTFLIEGVCYHGAFFRRLSESGTRIGSVVRVIERARWDGMIGITLQDITNGYEADMIKLRQYEEGNELIAKMKAATVLTKKGA
jgi:hypothetical protein